MVVISPKLGSPRLFIDPRSRRCLEMVVEPTPHTAASVETVSSLSDMATCRKVIACVVVIHLCMESRYLMTNRQ
jgi:hypothetical protein